jgi:hypothetical protein
LSEDKIIDPSKCLWVLKHSRIYIYIYIYIYIHTHICVKVYKVHILFIIHIIVGFEFPILLQSNYGIIPSFFYTTYLGYWYRTRYWFPNSCAMLYMNAEAGLGSTSWFCVMDRKLRVYFQLYVLFIGVLDCSLMEVYWSCDMKASRNMLLRQRSGNIPAPKTQGPSLGNSPSWCITWQQRSCWRKCFLCRLTQSYITRTNRKISISSNCKWHPSSCQRGHPTSTNSQLSDCQCKITLNCHHGRVASQLSSNKSMNMEAEESP